LYNINKFAQAKDKKIEKQAIIKEILIDKRFNRF